MSDANKINRGMWNRCWVEAGDFWVMSLGWLGVIRRRLFGKDEGEEI